MKKTLQQIKDEVAKGLGYPHWNELLHWEAHNHYLGLTLEKAIDQVAIRYAQEHNRELVDNIQLLLQSLDYDALGVMSGLIIEDLKELLTKHKNYERI